MKKTAYEYWKQGHVIVTMKEKTPLIEWKMWQTQGQSQFDFDSQPWDKADGFAIVGGKKLKNDLYVGCIDFDVKNIKENIIQIGKDILKTAPITQREKTPSGGEHWIYYSKTKIRTVKIYHNSHALELLGEKTLIIMAPSRNYIRLNDSIPSEKGDVEAYFYRLLGKEKPHIQGYLHWGSRRFLNQEQGHPYKGNHPPCISRLMRGVEAGQRNEATIRLVSYFLNFRLEEPEKTGFKIHKWNKKFNRPPLSIEELDSIFKSTLENNYCYGCNDPLLKQFCESMKCRLKPLMEKELDEQKLTEKNLLNADKLLLDPRFMKYVLLHGRRLLIGEDRLLITNFVSICSGQTKYPISRVISGVSGSGKNESVRAIRPLFPKGWIYEFTTSTPEAIKYIPEDFHGTLLIYELQGITSPTGTLGLRAIGEGESIETIYPVRDPEGGKMVLERAKTNAKNFITTSSDIDIAQDLFRRVIRSSMDEGDALTREVIKKKLDDGEMPFSLKKLLGIDEKVEYSIGDIKAALAKLDWSPEVIVLKPQALIKLIDLAVKKEQRVALRSHIDRILNFIRLLGIIFQKQRVRIVTNDPTEKILYVFTSPADFELSIKTIGRSVLETIQRITKRQNIVLDLFENHDKVDKHLAAATLGISDVTAAKCLKTLSKTGYLREFKTTKPYTYELAVKPQKRHNPLVPTDYISEYKRSYDEKLKIYLEHTLSTFPSDIPPFKIINPEAEQIVEIEFLDFDKGISERQGDKVLSKGKLDAYSPMESKDLSVSERTSPNKANMKKEVIMENNKQTHVNPDFLWRKIKPSEPCESCGKHPVENEVNDIHGRQILRRCPSCFEAFRKRLTGSVWREASSEVE